MENQIQVFNSSQFGDVRTVEINGEPHFVAADVCKALEIGNPTMALGRLDDDEQALISIEGISKGNDNANVVTESGLYSLVLGSRKPEAKQFKRWITHDVIPSIRKHGAYMTDNALSAALADPRAMANMLLSLADEREKRKSLESTVAIQQQQIAEYQPKAGYYDVILNCKDAVSISQIAKDYGKSAIWLNEKLHELGVQFKQGEIWLLYQKYAEFGYTSTRTHNYIGNDGETHAKIHTYWTQKGRLFIYELLKKNGILPHVEQEDSNDATHTADR